MGILCVYSLAWCGPYGGSNRRKHALGAKSPSGNEQQVLEARGRWTLEELNAVIAAVSIR